MDEYTNNFDSGKIRDTYAPLASAPAPSSTLGVMTNTNNISNGVKDIETKFLFQKNLRKNNEMINVNSLTEDVQKIYKLRLQKKRIIKADINKFQNDLSIGYRDSMNTLFEINYIK